MAGRIALLKAFDSLAGRMAVPLAGLLSLAEKQSGPLGSILLIRPGGIGDAVLLVPAIQAIRRRFPAVRLTILAERRNGSVFQLCSEADQVLLYDRPRDLIAAVAGRYDVVIDTEQWHHLSAVVARLTRAPMLIGFATNERARLFTDTVEYSHEDYESDSFLHLLHPLGILLQQPPRSRYLQISDQAAARAAGLIKSCGDLSPVVIFPGASIPERRWGADRFGRLARLLRDCGLAVVIVGGAGDREEGEAIAEVSGALNLTGTTSLVETAAVIDRSSLLISADSGILHLAVGLDRPTVSLFGPGISAKWAPRGPLDVIIDKKLPCSPCTRFGSTPPCPLSAKCMSDITVEEVFNAATMVLTESGALKSACCKRDWIETA